MSPHPHSHSRFANMSKDAFEFWFWLLIVPMVLFGMLWPPLALIPVAVHAIWIGFGIWLANSGFRGS